LKGVKHGMVGVGRSIQVEGALGQCHGRNGFVVDSDLKILIILLSSIFSILGKIIQKDQRRDRERQRASEQTFLFARM